MVDSDGEHADHVARTGSDDRGSKDPSREAFDIDDSSPAFARGLSRSLANFERNAQLPPDIEGDERITQIWCVGSSLIAHRSSLIAHRLGPVSPLEALFVKLSAHDGALALGGGHSVVASGVRARGTTVDVVSGHWPSIQLTRRYTLAIVEAPSRSQDLAAAVHCAAQHVGPGGELVLMLGNADHLAERFDLRELDRFDLEGIEVVRFRRTDRVTVHDKVFAARSRIGRVTPQDLAASRLSDNAPTVVDTRTATDRGRFGVIAGSIHVPRTLVEWHLDPANGYRHADVTSFDQPLVLVCNGGYSSSLAADSLLDLGFTDVSDLIGGIRAWVEAGLDVVEPDHSHLDL